MRRLIGLFVLMGASAMVAAQDYVEVRLVEVEVRVVDRDGRPVPDLDRRDFRLQEDGLAHEIANVQFVPAVQPLTTVLERPGEAPVETEVPVLAPPTWVYVTTEVGATDIHRVVKGIREFLLDDLPPGFRVSLAGLPFSDDKSRLLQTLAWLERNPNGDGTRTGLTNLQGPFADEAAEDRAMVASFRRQETGTSPLMGFPVAPDRSEIDASFVRPVLTEGQMERQLPMYGDLALVKYFDLVERLATLPGKKAIVLMRPGLRLEQDNQGLLRDLAGFAARRRVSFYTVDSRGLDASPPVDDRFIAPFVDRRRRPEPDLIGQMEMRELARSGLKELARETGGRALIGTNRMADAFEAVADDASGYYVLSYYPIDLRSDGRFREIEISTFRPGVKVKQATRGYYEPRPRSMFTDSDRGLALRRAMQDEEPPDDLPASASVAFFASREGWPVLVLGTGVPASQLTPKDEDDKPTMSVRAMVRIADRQGQRMPMYFERTLSAELTPEEWDRVRRDRSKFLSMSDLLPLLPGEYDWRVVFRDEESGRLGGLEGTVTLRDFRGASTPSTLLVTREVTRREAAPAPENAEPLDVGALRFLPQASPVFRQGETVHLLYALYNATAEDITAAERGMQLGLFHNGRPITDVEAFGQPTVDRASGTIRFTGHIRTDTLPPGTYRVMAVLPNQQARTEPHLQQMFVILPPEGV